jgi:general secretion pathway protein N
MKIQFEGSVFKFGWLSGLIALLCILLVTMIYFPARWLAPNLEKLTSCKVVLSYPQGSIWKGSTSIGFAEPSMTNPEKCSPPYAVTEAFYWESKCSIHDFQCRFIIEHNDLDKPIELVVRPKSILIRANHADLPSNFLESIGSPWKSLHPRGRLKLQWTDFTWSNDPKGFVQIQLVNMASPISPIKPLGSYELKFQVAKETQLNLFTLNGPLVLNGTGQFKNGNLVFQGEATAAPESIDSLIGLLSIIGIKDGAIYRFKIEGKT